MPLICCLDYQVWSDARWISLQGLMACTYVVPLVLTCQTTRTWFIHVHIATYTHMSTLTCACKPFFCFSTALLCSQHCKEPLPHPPRSSYRIGGLCFCELSMLGHSWPSRDQIAQLMNLQGYAIIITTIINTPVVSLGCTGGVIIRQTHTKDRAHKV